MKIALKIFTVLLFSPMFLLALLFGVLRFLFEITIIFSWYTSDNVTYWLLNKSKGFIDFIKL